MTNSPTPQQLKELEEFLCFRSISTQPERNQDLRSCAEWVLGKLRAMGLEAELQETGGHPVVLGRTTPDPGKRTVLIYGHYDVQPPEPLEEWTSPPFEPAFRDGRVFARGSSDNKGQIYAHMAGVAETLAENGELPVNVIFLIEGEEEIGSPNLAAFLRENAGNLQADVAIISDSGMAAHGVPTLAYSLRGVAAMECIVRGPSRDLHSGVYGGAVMNPVTAAARLVATLHDAEGRVTISGFYDRVRDLEDWERKALAEAPSGNEAILEQTGSVELFGEPGFTSLERIGARPTAEVNGFGGGYQGPGTKTVLPRSAFFKLTFRLVPDQSAAEILELAERHLRDNCPAGVTLEVSRGHSGEPYLFDPKSAAGEAAVRALEITFGRKACLLREGGSIPILLDFQKILGVDSLLLALASPDCNAHSPDENFPLENLGLGIRLNQAILKELASVPSATFRGDLPKESADKVRGHC